MLIVIDEIRRRFGSPSLYTEDQMNEAHISALSFIDHLTGQFADVSAITREACAQIADRAAVAHTEMEGEVYIARKIADAIRADGPRPLKTGLNDE